MPILRFEGYSDDTFGEVAHFKDDYDNCASGKPIEYLVLGPAIDGQPQLGVVVTGQHCPGGRPSGPPDAPRRPRRHHAGRTAADGDGGEPGRAGPGRRQPHRHGARGIVQHRREAVEQRRPQPGNAAQLGDGQQRAQRARVGLLRAGERRVLRRRRAAGQRAHLHDHRIGQQSAPGDGLPRPVLQRGRPGFAAPSPCPQ